MTREASRTVSLGVLDDGARYRLGLLAVGIAASCPPTAALWHQVAQAVEGGHLVFELPADVTGGDVAFFADQLREAIIVVCARGHDDLPGRELVVLSELFVAAPRPRFRGTVAHAQGRSQGLSGAKRRRYRDACWHPAPQRRSAPRPIQPKERESVCSPSGDARKYWGARADPLAPSTLVRGYR
jgi:hypothetical protein